MFTHTLQLNHYPQKVNRRLLQFKQHARDQQRETETLLNLIFTLLKSQSL